MIRNFTILAVIFFMTKNCFWREKDHLEFNVIECTSRTWSVQLWYNRGLWIYSGDTIWFDEFTCIFIIIVLFLFWNDRKWNHMKRITRKESNSIAAFDGKFSNPVACYTKTLSFGQHDCQMSKHLHSIFLTSPRSRSK